jgi:hypothetical protein
LQFNIRLVFSSSNDSDSSGDVKSPFEQFDKTTIFKYKITPVNESTTNLIVHYLGEEIFNFFIDTKS